VTYSRAIPAVLFAGIFLLTTLSRVHGQPPANFAQDDFQHRMVLYDVDGHPIGGETIETKGSPLFLTKWKLGWMRLADNRLFPGLPLRLDLEKQIAHYMRADGTDIEVQQGMVKELVMLDTLAGTPVAYRFVTGLQPIDNQTPANFYLLLDSGRLSLLESMRKVFRQDKNEYSGETEREYKVYDDFYVLSSGKMARIRKDSRFFLELTNDKKTQMDDYLQKHKVSFRSIEDIRQFIHYYNDLP